MNRFLGVAMPSLKPRAWQYMEQAFRNAYTRVIAGRLQARLRRVLVGSYAWGKGNLQRRDLVAVQSAVIN